MKLPVANYVSNTDDCIKLIKRNNAKTMPLRSSIIYFNYLSNPNCSLGSYKYCDLLLFNGNARLSAWVSFGSEEMALKKRRSGQCFNGIAPNR